ncbi:hypothetical protein B0H14DRAFT_3716303 [Mycena olivaceomarginata]|nr:hypothetical protein B0H14DRAFT_3716303 [Mycena olivaceomarginata]
MCGDFPSHITMKTITLKAIREVVPQPHTAFGHCAKLHSFSVFIIRETREKDKNAIWRSLIQLDLAQKPYTWHMQIGTEMCSLELPHLNYLDLLPTDVEFTETLRNGHFPNLSTLLYTASYWSARTIGSHSSVESQDLHWLRSFVSAFGPDDSSTIASVFLLWYHDDLDVEAPLLHLGKIASPDEFMAIFTSDPLEASTILGGVATHLPRIKVLRIMDCESGISHEGVLEIATHLKQLESLSTLEIAGTDDSPVFARFIPGRAATAKSRHPGDAGGGLASLLLAQRRMSTPFSNSANL